MISRSLSPLPGKLKLTIRPTRNVASDHEMRSTLVHRLEKVVECRTRRRRSIIEADGPATIGSRGEIIRSEASDHCKRRMEVSKMSASRVARERAELRRTYSSRSKRQSCWYPLQQGSKALLHSPREQARCRRACPLLPLLRRPRSTSPLRRGQQVKGSRRVERESSLGVGPTVPGEGYESAEIRA